MARRLDRTSGDRSAALRDPLRVTAGWDDEDCPVLRRVPLGDRLAPLRYDDTGPLVYVTLSSGRQVSLSDANDAVGLQAVLHPVGAHDDALPSRYVRHDGVEVVEVTTTDGLLLVPSALVPYDPCGGRTVGPGVRS